MGRFYYARFARVVYQHVGFDAASKYLLFLHSMAIAWQGPLWVAFFQRCRPRGRSADSCSPRAAGKFALIDAFASGQRKRQPLENFRVVVVQPGY
jgi:hypothetical protein